MDDIRHNYALTAEEHYYNIRFTLNGNQFNRIVTITDEALFKTEKENGDVQKQLANFKLVQSYVIYYFPRK
jgi:hypothetical protein